MSDAAPARRTTARWFAILAALAVSGTLLLLNLDGYHNHLGGDLRDEPPLINWAHGWPWPGVVRPSTYPIGMKGQVVTRSRGPRAPYSRWPIDNAPIAAVMPWALLLDGAMFVVLTTGAAWGAWWLALRHQLPNYFGLKWLFVAPIVAALAVHYGRPWMQATKSRIVAHAIAMSLLTIAVLLTAYAASCLVRNIAMRRRRSSAEPLATRYGEAG